MYVMPPAVQPVANFDLGITRFKNTIRIICINKSMLLFILTDFAKHDQNDCIQTIQSNSQ